MIHNEFRNNHDDMKINLIRVSHTPICMLLSACICDFLTSCASFTAVKFYPSHLCNTCTTVSCKYNCIWGRMQIIGEKSCASMYKCVSVTCSTLTKQFTIAKVALCLFWDKLSCSSQPAGNQSLLAVLFLTWLQTMTRAHSKKAHNCFNAKSALSLWAPD